MRRNARNASGQLGRYLCEEGLTVEEGQQLAKQLNQPEKGEGVGSHGRANCLIRQLHHLLGPRLGVVGLGKLAAGLIFVKIAILS
jgi:hypothetical protein